MLLSKQLDNWASHGSYPTANTRKRMAMEADMLEDLVLDMYEAWREEVELSASRPMFHIRMETMGLLDKERGNG